MASQPFGDEIAEGERQVDDAERDLPDRREQLLGSSGTHREGGQDRHGP